MQASYTRFFESPALPDPREPDLIIVMGGPMSVHDEAIYPWRRPEKHFLQSEIQRGASILGICLGAQLIACALGCRVFKNPVKEIGWFPIEGISGADATFQFPPVLNVFHWHGETFEEPEGAVRLAQNNTCANQAYQLGRNVISLQFHLETTPASVQALLKNCADDLVPGEYIQPESRLRAAPDEAYAIINAQMNA